MRKGVFLIFVSVFNVNKLSQVPVDVYMNSVRIPDLQCV